MLISPSSCSYFVVLVGEMGSQMRERAVTIFSGVQSWKIQRINREFNGQVWNFKMIISIS